MAFEAAPTNDLLITVTDSAGKYATTRFHVAPTETDPSDGLAADIVDAVQACSDGLVSKAEILIYAVDEEHAAPSSGPFDRVTDKMRIEFLDEVGIRATLELPSVNEGILMPDGETLDQADAAVIAFKTAMLAGAVSAEGNPLVTLRGGYRKRNKGIKKQ